MKVIIGGNKTPRKVLSFPTGTPPVGLERQLSEEILQVMANRTFAVSPERLQRLANQLEAAAEAEAYKLFEVIDSIVGRRQLVFGSPQISNPLDPEVGGRITWKPLSPDYAQWKGRSVARARRGGNGRFGSVRPNAGMFVLTGTMKNYFGRSGRTIVKNRFGGVRVKADTSQMSQSADAYFGRANATVILGRIQIQIYPLISPALMPMLASRRWTDVGPHSLFERETMAPMTANKLSGGEHGPYRPLVLPITQFFILHRIPGAISRELKRSLRTTLRSRASVDATGS